MKPVIKLAFVSSARFMDDLQRRSYIALCNNNMKDKAKEMDLELRRVFGLGTAKEMEILGRYVTLAR